MKHQFLNCIYIYSSTIYLLIFSHFRNSHNGLTSKTSGIPLKMLITLFFANKNVSW